MPRFSKPTILATKYLSELFNTKVLSHSNISGNQNSKILLICKNLFFEAIIFIYKTLSKKKRQTMLTLQGCLLI